MTGRLVALFVAAEAGGPVVRVPEATALPGLGLAGDRYAAGEGSFSRWPGGGRAVSLIAAEAVREAEADYGVSLADGEHRRNLVVSDVPLGDLRGARFTIGEVEFEGVRFCAPCRYLVRVTGQARVFDALVGRGGLRADVISGGVLREGDAVTWETGTVPRRRLPR